MLWSGLYLETDESGGSFQTNIITCAISYQGRGKVEVFTCGVWSLYGGFVSGGW